MEYSDWIFYSVLFGKHSHGGTKQRDEPKYFFKTTFYPNLIEAAVQQPFSLVAHLKTAKIVRHSLSKYVKN